MGSLLLWSWGDMKGGAFSPALGWWTRHSPCHLTPNGKDGLYTMQQLWGAWSYLGESHFLHSDSGVFH